MKRTETKETYIETAKNLYLLTDEKGNRKHSYREIETLLKQAYKNCSISYITLSRVAKRDGWERLFQESKNLSVEKALTEKGDNEKIIKDKKAEELSDLFKLNMYLHKKAGMRLKEMIDSGEMPAGIVARVYKDTFDNVKSFFDELKDKIGISAEENIIRVEIK